MMGDQGSGWHQLGIVWVSQGFDSDITPGVAQVFFILLSKQH